MQKIDSFFSQDWISEVETRFEMNCDERRSLPLYEIIKNFKFYIESNQQDLNEQEKVEFAEKVKTLSEEKLDYYRSSRFGFIKQIFSAFRNGLLMGRWQSSGLIGLELSQQIIHQSRLTALNDEDNEAIPTWIKKRNLRAKMNQQGLNKTSKRNQISEKSSELIPSDDTKPISDDLKSPLSDDLKKRLNDTEVKSVSTNDCKKTIDKKLDIKEMDRKDLVSESKQTHLPKEKKRGVVKKIQTVKPPKVKTANEKMMETFETVWKSANSREKAFVLEVWQTLTSKAEVISWTPTDKSDEFQLELKCEVSGTQPEIPIGYLVLKQKMKVAFSGKYDLESHCYKHSLIFSDQGVCHRVGIGWFAKDTSIKSITIEEDSYQSIWCSGEVLGQKFVLSSEDILDFFKQIQWN